MRWSYSTAERYLREKMGCATVQRYSDAARAVDRLDEIYREGCKRILTAGKKLKAGVRPSEVEPKGCYPLVAVAVRNTSEHSETAYGPYGICQIPGLYVATVTQVKLFRKYWLEQLALLIKHHGEVIIAISGEQIPLKYVDGTEELALSGPGTDHFHRLNPPEIGLSNRFRHSSVRPLAFFSAPQTDYWRRMGTHHMGSARPPQSFIILANYSFYVQKFAEFARSAEAKKAGYTTFTPATMSKVGRAVIPPQMPAYHLAHKSGHGITLIQIGVGAPNALTIATELAIYRPQAMILAGHAASMRREIGVGHYIVGESFFRDTPFYDHEVALDVPIPHIREISTELRTATMAVLGCDKAGLKQVLHAGTVASTMRRDWELSRKTCKRLLSARPVAVEMEAAYLMAAAFNFAIPTGVFLCASDSPLFGQVKEHGASRAMYGARTMEHLKITIAAIDGLRNRVVDGEAAGLPPSHHSRKLRGIYTPPLR